MDVGKDHGSVPGTVHTRGKSLWGWLRNVNLWNNLGFSLCTAPSVCYMVVILREMTISQKIQKRKVLKESVLLQLLTSQMFLLSITNLLMFSVKPKLKSLLFIIFIISRST